ncbi:MAG: alpha/beta hydrolase [Acaryochloridaceae cyanobacterium RL_2_7]|nr:alpha/beta hydrolase [Acaryochloridaceae cyanobacterium RL_2_7]
MQTVAQAPLSSFQWQWQDQKVSVTYTTQGQGEPLLVLPAFSTVSSQLELQALTRPFLSNFQITTLDWPGFGDSDRLKLDYGPELYQRFIHDFVAATFSKPITVIAPGHSAGYALSLQDSCGKLVLIAPTWKGPLVAMGIPPTVRKSIHALVRSPLIGQSLYGINTHPKFLAWMYRRHVFKDPAKLTDEFITSHHAVTQKTGARYAPAAFVTGHLDPSLNREDFLALMKNFKAPIQVILAEDAPPKSKAEMKAIAALKLPNLSVLSHPGTLGMTEEFGAELAELIRPFLAP